MMRNLYKANICFLLFAISTLLFALPLEARVTGSCSNCHTMHNSQGGQSVAQDFNGLSFSPTDTPKKNLLIYSCLGCHSSTVNTWQDNITKAPIVFNTVPPTYGSQGLAGGNFYWVIDDETKGHNILSEDRQLDRAPGDTGFFNCVTNACHQNLYAPVSAPAYPELDGKQGCEKCHLDAKHHANDHEYLVGGLVTTADQGWYRFLSGHNTGDEKGVEGYEDGDWQKTCSQNDHNEYLGNESAIGYGFLILGHTTTAYCTGCHVLFHSDQGSQSPWLRHPSAETLPASGEYANYTVYNCTVPVARPSLPPSDPSQVIPGADIVMCLSCHRAHASPYYKMMRWDYKSSNLSDALSGCNVCHTSKN